EEAQRQPGGVTAGMRKSAAAPVPAEVVELVAAGGQGGPADDLSVPGRRRVGVEHGERVRLLRLAVEGDHVSQLFGRGADRVRRTAVKSRVDAVTSGMIHWYYSS